MPSLPRPLCLLVLALLSLLAIAAPSFAQPVAPEPEASPSRFLASRMDDMRTHVQRMGEAVPAMPANLRRVAANLGAIAGEAGAGRIALGALLWQA